AGSVHPAIDHSDAMSIEGGSDGADVHDPGRTYHPPYASSTPTPTTNAPEARAGHTAIWTGSEMIVWGGAISFNFSVTNTGGKYCAGGGPPPTPTPTPSITPSATPTATPTATPRVTPRPRPTPDRKSTRLN